MSLFVSRSARTPVRRPVGPRGGSADDQEIAASIDVDVDLYAVRGGRAGRRGLLKEERDVDPRGSLAQLASVDIQVTR